MTGEDTTQDDNSPLSAENPVVRFLGVRDRGEGPLLYNLEFLVPVSTMEPPPKRRSPLVTRLDWVLLSGVVAAFATADLLSYLGGRFSDSFWGSGVTLIAYFLLSFVALTLWVALGFRPALWRWQTFRWEQLVLRPFLLAVLGAAVLCHGKVMDAPPAVLGKKHDFTSHLNEEDFDALRLDAAVGLKRSGSDYEMVKVPIEKLPGNFRRLHRGHPVEMHISLHQNGPGIEIQMIWGWALEGYHGLMIDPEEPEGEGFSETDDGHVSWCFKVAEGVYFFAHNG